MIAGSNKVTPEEKLLHIIENSPDTGKLSLKKAMNGAAEKTDDPARGNPLAFLNKLDPRNMTLHGINKLCIGICMIVTAVIVFYYVQDMQNIDVKFDYFKKTAETRKSPFRAGKKQDIPAVAKYLADTEKSNPFHILPVIEKPRKKIKQKLKLQLVGILWSDRPQAVLEDATTQKNFMVHEGDTVDKFTVEKITANNVLLVSEDGETTLE